MKTISGDALLRVLTGEDPTPPRARGALLLLVVALALAWSAWLGCALRGAGQAPGPAAQAHEKPR